MTERINDKIREIEKYLDELLEIIPGNLSVYSKDFKAKAACERYAERIIEAVVDLAYLVIKAKNLPLPESDLQAFDILSGHKLVALELARRLQDAKRMRNIIAHEYGEINDEIVFYSLKDELDADVRAFIRLVKKNCAI